MKQAFIKLFIILISSSGTIAQQRGDIVSFDFLQFYDADSFGVEVQQQIGLPPSILGLEYDFNVFRVLYYTEDIKPDSLTIASSLVAIPTNYVCDELGIMSYGHGLCLKDDCVPSNNFPWSGYSFITKGMAANGFIGVAPDYIHMSQYASPGPQAFIHARTEATATIDLIRAVRKYCADNNIQLTGQVFLSGYSQGGNSSVATAKMMQELHPTEFNIAGVYAGGGSYDISGICADSLSSTSRKTPERHSLPLVIKSLSVVYEDSLIVWGTGLNINNIIDSVFKSPYDTLIPKLVDRKHPFSDNSVLDSIPARMIEDSILFYFQTDPNHYFRRVLADNDIYDWSPQMPLVLFHSDIDIENPYENAIFTLQKFQQNGAPDVQLVTVNGLSHPDAGQPHVLYGINFMREKRVDCTTGIKEIKSNTPVVNIFPNPTSSKINVVSKNNFLIKDVAFYDISLKKLNIQSDSGNNTFDISHFLPGNYLIAVEGMNGDKVFKMIIKE
jgi:hypothetical protein